METDTVVRQKLPNCDLVLGRGREGGVTELRCPLHTQGLVETKNPPTIRVKRIAKKL